MGIFFLGSDRNEVVGLFVLDDLENLVQPTNGRVKLVLKLHLRSQTRRFDRVPLKEQTLASDFTLGVAFKVFDCDLAVAGEVYLVTHPMYGKQSTTEYFLIFSSDSALRSRFGVFLNGCFWAKVDIYKWSDSSS